MWFDLSSETFLDGVAVILAAVLLVLGAAWVVVWFLSHRD